MPNFPKPYDIDIHISDPLWAESLSDIQGVCRVAIERGFEVLSGARYGEVSIALVSDEEIRALNRDYRHKDKATNVLSFPAGEHVPILGDIVIARETVLREAKAKPVSVNAHFTHLLIHGFLHLQGYDHGTDKEAAIMEGYEIQALKTLGIANPYVLETSNE